MKLYFFFTFLIASSFVGLVAAQSPSQAPKQPPVPQPQQPVVSPSAPPPAPTPAMPSPQSQSPGAAAFGSPFSNPEGYNYDPMGRRDPFKAYGESQATQAPEQGEQRVRGPLEMYDVGQFKLVGIVWNVRDPKAMVRDPLGKLHMVRRETRIGRNNGFVAAIREGEVIIVEPTIAEDGMQTAVTRTLTLKR
ncbi:MAG: pilus assembly protein PilP [Pseudobdellovibrionaceae bacterium]